MNEELDFRAAEDHSAGTGGGKPVDDLDVLRPRLLAEQAEAELVVDDR